MDQFLNPESKPVKHKNKRKVISLDVKLQVLQMYDEGKKNMQIAREMLLSESTVRAIKKNEIKIRNCSAQLHSESKNAAAVKINNVSHPLVRRTESLLYSWICDQRVQGVHTNCSIIQGKALAIYEYVKFEVGEVGGRGPKFSASKGWLAKFKKRYNLHSIKLSGEAENLVVECTGNLSENLNDLGDIKEETNTSPEPSYSMDNSKFYWNNASTSNLQRLKLAGEVENVVVECSGNLFENFDESPGIKKEENGTRFLDPSYNMDDAKIFQDICKEKNTAPTPKLGCAMKDSEVTWNNASTSNLFSAQETQTVRLGGEVENNTETFHSIASLPCVATEKTFHRYNKYGSLEDYSIFFNMVDNLKRQFSKIENSNERRTVFCNSLDELIDPKKKQYKEKLQSCKY